MVPTVLRWLGLSVLVGAMAKLLIAPAFKFEEWGVVETWILTMGSLEMDLVCNTRGPMKDTVGM